MQTLAEKKTRLARLNKFAKGRDALQVEVDGLTKKGAALKGDLRNKLLTRLINGLGLNAGIKEDNTLEIWFSKNSLGETSPKILDADKAHEIIGKLEDLSMGSPEPAGIYTHGGSIIENIGKTGKIRHVFSADANATQTNIHSIFFNFDKHPESYGLLLARLNELTVEYKGKETGAAR